MIALSKRLVFGATLLAAAVGVRAAHGACSVPAPEIFWSYPTDGATDVPVNARIWLLPNLARDREVPPALDGVPLPYGRLSRSYEPGVLEPNWTYTLSVAFNDSGLADAPNEITLQFTTGTRTVDASLLPAPKVTAHQLLGFGDNYGWPASVPCGDLMSAFGCFDTGQVALYGFEAEGAAIAWLVERVTGPAPSNEDLPSEQLLPGVCGPGIIGERWPGIFEQGCYYVHAIHDGGLTVASNLYCPPLQTPDAALAGSDSGVRDAAPADSSPNRNDAARPELLADASRADGSRDAAQPAQLTQRSRLLRASGGGCSIGPVRNVTGSMFLLALVALFVLAVRRGRSARKRCRGYAEKVSRTTCIVDADAATSSPDPTLPPMGA